MCDSASVGVIQDKHGSSISTGSTFAHEMGHLFNMDHDGSKYSDVTVVEIGGLTISLACVSM